MSKTYTLQETLGKVAELIKAKIAEHEAFVENLNKKELEPKHGKLAKSEICLICTEPEMGCSCLKKSELAKKTPPDISEKTMHKLKDEYGHDKKGKEKAYATAWSIENKMKGKTEKAEISTGKEESTVGDANGTVDKKMKKNDPAMGGPEGDAMEMTEKSEMCKSCGKEMKLCKCMGKAEVTSVPSAKANPGSGGETKKVPLKKNALPSVKHPEAQGVGGKQPVGMGGGDANKVANPAAGAQLGDAKGLAKAPPTPIAQVNKELGGFKSIAVAKPAMVKTPRVNPKMAAPTSQRFHGALPLQRNEVQE